MQKTVTTSPSHTTDTLFDERVDDAVRKLQALWRGRKARALLQQLIRSSYLKVHGETGGYLYLNRRTKELSKRKPFILKDDDLPSPRAYEAPYDYDPGLPPIPMYACVITCSTFDSREIPMLDSVVTNDHAMIKDTMLHPFLCRFSADDCVFLEDPTLDLVKHTLEDLRRCEKEGSLLVYLCTHAAFISNGKLADNHLLFHDSSWRTRESAINTSLSISDFAQLVQAIPCKHKTILLHACHRPPPSKDVLKKKLLYPGSSLYIDLAEKSGATVIGSCQIGTPFEQAHQHMQLLRRRRKRVVGLLPRGVDEDRTVKKLRDQLAHPRDRSSMDPTVTRGVDGTYSVSMPTEWQEAKHNMRKKLCKYAETAIWTYQMMMRLHKGSDVTDAHHQQQSLYGQRYSTFAQSFVQAVNGGAAVEFDELVTAKAVYLQMAEHLVSETAVEEEQRQHYAIACAHGGEPLQVVCAAPGRPPAPFVPTIVHVDASSVSMRWEEPGFDGIPTARYRIYFRTLARAYNHWTILKTSSAIVDKCYRVVHLTTGVPIAFKVAAWNSGGWGDPSPPTEFVIPGGDNSIPALRNVLTKLRFGGVYSTILRLESVGHLRHEARVVMRLLAALLSKSKGFKRLAFAKRGVAAALRGMQLHSLDVDVCAAAIQVVSWGCKSYDEAADQLRSSNFVDIIKQNKAHWRLEPRILRAFELLRATDSELLPADILADEQLSGLENGDVDALTGAG